MPGPGKCGRRGLSGDNGVSMHRRSLRIEVRVVLASLLGAVAIAEAVLRLAGYRFPPTAFFPPEDARDTRARQMESLDPRVSTREPVTLFDGDLLWRLNPRASGRINDQGCRGPRMTRPKGAGQFLIVALGDSDTMGGLDAEGHWPANLQELIELNEHRGSVQVVNAGVAGYSSLQGLRRLEQILRYEPDLVYLSFGASDAQPARAPDAEWARRARWVSVAGWLRLAPPVVHYAWKALGGGVTADEPTHRVAPSEFKRNLQELVWRTRARRAMPVLLTQPRPGPASRYDELVRRVMREMGAPGVDLARQLERASGLLRDGARLTGRGHRRVAQVLLAHLRSLGVVETERLYAAELDLATAADDRLELVSGWWSREILAEGGGRWTQAEASLLLERRGQEGAVSLDLRLASPQDLTTGRVEVNGREVHAFRERNGRQRWMLDIREVRDPRLSLRLVVDRPFVPRDQDPASGDDRSLGVFVHAVRLVESRYPAGADLGRVEDGSPELGPGWWSREALPGGGLGRWTRSEASLSLGRAHEEGGLLVDLSFGGGLNLTTGRVEVNGRRVYGFRNPNGHDRRILDIRAVPGREVVVRFVVDRTFVPRDQDPASPDARSLGLFVHEVRLVPSPVP